MTRHIAAAVLAVITVLCLAAIGPDGAGASPADPCARTGLFAPPGKKDARCAEREQKKPDDAAKYEPASKDAKGKGEEAPGHATPDAASPGAGDKGKDAPREKAAEAKDAGREGAESERSPSLFGMFSHDDPDPANSFTLKPFGQGIFASTDGPPETLPAEPDYPVGAGDEIGIALWGRVTAEYRLVVSNEGVIEIPMIGPVVVNGLSFKEVRELIARRVKGIVGADASVTMGRLRSIQVFVLGEVARPGAYKVSSVATVTNALMAAGGTAPIGSLRRVELRRQGEKPRQIDFYDLLLRGDKSGDARLRNGDVVFVPVIGPVVGVGGNVKRPAVYETRGGASLQEALDLAGGVVPNAYTQQVQVERIEGNSRRVVIDIDASAVDRARAFAISDGDFIKVSSVTGKEANAVYLYGNVKRPGKYQLKAGMRLGDLITGYGALVEETHLDYALIKRLTPELRTMVVPFNLGLLLDGAEGENIALEPNDSIYVFSTWLFRERPVVTIEGEVRLPGPIPIDENHTVKDLVLLAGGPTAEASYGEYELYRKEGRTRELKLHRLDLGRALTQGGPDNPVLRDGDIVRIHSAREADPERTVIVYGQVNRPGQYPYAANMRVADLVFAGGGLKESAYLREAELASYEVEGGQAARVNYRSVDLELALAGDEAHNVALSAYDSLFVREMTGWGSQHFVEVNGEVRFPGKYLIRKGEKLSSVIRRAGGFTDEAYLKGAVFTRESVRRLQQKSLEEAINRIEVRLLTQASGQALSATNAEGPKQVETAMSVRRELIAKLRGSKAQGRISIDIEEVTSRGGASHDISLEHGDTLHVPARPTQVQVMGAVSNPAAFVHEQKERLSGYIALAGGLSSEADRDRIFVLKSDGTAVSRSDFSWGLSGGLMSARLDPGDTIVVPERLDKGLWLREVRDITQILYQIAVTAGVLIVAF